MPNENTMECACGDSRPLSQMYLRCTGNAGADMTYVVECVDCTISAGADIAVWPTLSRLLGTPQTTGRAPRARPDERDGAARQGELIPSPVKHVVGHLDSRYEGPQQVYRGRVFRAEVEFLVSRRDATEEQIEEAFSYSIGADSVLRRGNPLGDCDFDITEVEIEGTGEEAWAFWDARGKGCEPGHRRGRCVRVPVGENPGFRYTLPPAETGEEHPQDRR